MYAYIYIAGKEIGKDTINISILLWKTKWALKVLGLTETMTNIWFGHTI